MQTPPAKSETIAKARSYRLPPRDGEVIDRSSTIKFSFDGREYVAHPGDSIASALAAAGVKVFSRSFKYHRPRGLLCCAGHCPNCLVQVGDEPNVRACCRLVQDGIDVRVQNAWPSLDRDLMALTQLGERFLPVGFYYKTFIHPQPLWPLYERVLRHVAGLGEVSRDTPRGEYGKQFLHADVAVIGGGPAGLSAARAAAERGARVMLFDENTALGGHLRFAGVRDADLTGLEDLSGLSIFADTTVLGWYHDNWLAAVQGSRLFKVRCKSIVIATGAYENPLVFDNNDLPGVMLGSAALRLLNLYGVMPGRRAVVVTASDDGWEVAAHLVAAGVSVAAMVDERTQDSCASTGHTELAARLPTFWEHTIVAARGSSAVTGAVIAQTPSPAHFAACPAGGIPRRGTYAECEGQGGGRSLDCDLIVVSVGWTPALELAFQAGAKAVYDEQRGETLATTVPTGICVAGRAAGTHDVDMQMMEGRLAGLSAAAHVGLGSPPSPDEQLALANRKAAAPRRTSTRVNTYGHKKRFVCYCEDVTDQDITTAIAEGFDSLELLKRYSTITMGPCQGKMCGMNAIHLCAYANHCTVQETGVTTSRQPITPVSLGSLAGQHMEPTQVTPIHAWHLAHGAKTMAAGLWLRPVHYGDPIAEVKAVRERVGLIDVSTLGKLRLTGPGVSNLLERIYINQWRNLGVGRVRYGVMCNDEGVVLDDGVCAHVDEHEWYMTTTTSGASAIYEWIQWWLQSGWGDGIHLTDMAEVFSAFNLAGPKSRDVLRKLTRLDVSNEAFPYMHVRSAEVAGLPCRLLRIGFTGELSYEIHCPSGYALHLWESLMEAGREFAIAPFGVEAQRVLRLEKAHIIVGQDTDASTDPISAEMGWAVKLDKPDFLGKRSLTRISAEGPKQKLVGFKMARAGVVPDEGLQIVRANPNGKLTIIGHITSSRFSPTLGEAIGLCWLPAELAAQNGASFTIRMNGKLEEARVYHGAFYDPKGERLRV